MLVRWGGEHFGVNADHQLEYVSYEGADHDEWREWHATPGEELPATLKTAEDTIFNEPIRQLDDYARAQTGEHLHPITRERWQQLDDYYLRLQRAMQLNAMYDTVIALYPDEIIQLEDDGELTVFLSDVHDLGVDTTKDWKRIIELFKRPPPYGFAQTRTIEIASIVAFLQGPGVDFPAGRGTHNAELRLQQLTQEAALRGINLDTFEAIVQQAAKMYPPRDNLTAAWRTLMEDKVIHELPETLLDVPPPHRLLAADEFFNAQPSLESDLMTNSLRAAFEWLATAEHYMNEHGEQVPMDDETVFEELQNITNYALSEGFPEEELDKLRDAAFGAE